MNRYRHWLNDEKDTYVQLWREKPKWAADLPVLLFLVGLLMASWWIGNWCTSSSQTDNSSISISVEIAPTAGDGGSAIRWKY